MHVHFDGDLLVYRAGFAAEKMHYYLVTDDEIGDETAKHFQYKKDILAYIDELGLEEGSYRIEQGREVEPLKNALYNVKSLVDKALVELEADHSDMTMYLSGPENFRNGVATLQPYKGNRDKLHKPVHGPKIREYMQRKYNAVVSENEEADDIVAYSHYREYLRDPYGSVIVSVDKDLDMIPGLHYNFVKQEGYFVDDDEADKFFQLQLLMGDSTDNIPGVPGIGKKKAEKALAGVENPWDVIADLYIQAYEEFWYEALLENGRLLWIRREPNEWWNPPEHVKEKQ